MMTFLKRSLLVLMLLSVLIGAVSEDPRTERANAIREKPTVVYTGHFEIACAPAVMHAVLDNPMVMGALWKAYDYTPRYKVSALAEPRAVHVQDPTGLIGDVWPVQDPTRRYVFLAEGTVDHWAVPILNAGAAVFDVDVAPGGPGTTVRITVSLKPESGLARAALWTLTPIAKSRIESRMTANFKDLRYILEAIATTPDAVAERLDAPARQAFERAFR